MKKLLAVTMLSQHNLRILHWKASTADFDPIHELMGSYVDQMGEWIDLFAEVGLMLGEDPIALHEVPSVLDACGIEMKAPDVNHSFTPVQIFTVVGYVLRQLQECIREKLKDESLPRGVQSELEVVDFWLTKELNYKNKQRLQNN